MAIQKKTYTSTEFSDIDNAPENVNRILELVEGEIVEKMPSFVPSMIAAEILTAIRVFLKANPLGYVTGADGGYVLSEEDTFNPDVGYISKERLPVMPEREAPVPPDLAVEVVSPTDSIKAAQRKARKYLRYGTRMVWIVYPEDKTVDICLPDEAEGMRIREVGIDGILDGGDVLPGFQLPVRDIFLA